MESRRYVSSLLFIVITLAGVLDARFSDRPIVDKIKTLSQKGDDYTDGELDGSFLGWAKWSAWSACSKTCGRGIQHQLRRCMDVHCSGVSSRYRICEMAKKCDSATRSDAQIECSLRARPNSTVRRRRGNAVDEWIPVTTTNSCLLTCASRLTGVQRHYANVALKNGAKCRLADVENAACLHTTCQRVGCDDIIGSTMRVDACGRCGGDGRSCTRRIFQWRNTQEFTPCEPKCGANRVRVSVSVCMNTVARRVVPERLCGDQPRPRPQIQSCPHIVCPAKWLTEPWSICSASCGDNGRQTRGVYCVETHTANTSAHVSDAIENRKVDDKYCECAARPIAARACSGSMTCPLWRAGEWSTCTTPCGVGVQKRHISCLIDGRRVNETQCQKALRPPDTQNCQVNITCAPTTNTSLALATSRLSDQTLPDFERAITSNNTAAVNNLDASLSTGANALDAEFADGKPRYSMGPWSLCSVTCGHGVRIRKIKCVLLQGRNANVISLADDKCDGQTKPKLFQPCQLAACESITATNAVDEIVIPGERFPPQPSVRRIALSGATFHWEYDEWTPCSVSCLGGRQKSTLKCVDVNRRLTMDASYCDATQRPVEMIRACNQQACAPDWEVGEFSACSHSCGGGVRSRRVRCVRIMSRSGGAESTLILPEAQCSLPRPVSDEPCGLVDCLPAWRLGRWSDCSTSCGPGEQRREVMCEQRDALGVLHVFEDDTRCVAPATNEDGNLLPIRPSTVRLCNLGPCLGEYSYVWPRIGSSSPPRGGGGRRHVSGTFEENHTLKQYRDVNPAIAANTMNENENTDNQDLVRQNYRKLTLDIGGFANLYKGTSVKVKCPVQNFARDKIFWTKDGKRIVDNAHIKVSANGALRIFHARIEDAGVFACYADGARGNVTLSFKPTDVNGAHVRKQIATNRTNPRQKSTPKSRGMNNNASINVRFNNEQLQKVKTSLLQLGERRILEQLERLNDPSHVRLDYAAGEWSRCSQLDCAQTDSAQVRMLRCRVYVAQLTAYVHDEICASFNIVRPPATRPCSDARCPRWETSEWSVCNKSRCLRAKTALQKRVVKCVYGNGTKADYDLCDRDSRPKVKKECINPSCTAEWRTSPWGQCSKTCGDGGVQMRLLRCVWHGTKKPAGRHCDITARPIAIRMCDAKSLRHSKCAPADDEQNKTAKFWKSRAISVSNATATNSNDMDANDVCEDESRFCSILRLFHSCDDAHIRQRCCFSCNFFATQSSTTSPEIRR